MVPVQLDVAVQVLSLHHLRSGHVADGLCCPVRNARQTTATTRSALLRPCDVSGRGRTSAMRDAARCRQPAAVPPTAHLLTLTLPPLANLAVEVPRPPMVSFSGRSLWQQRHRERQACGPRRWPNRRRDAHHRPPYFDGPAVDLDFTSLDEPNGGGTAATDGLIAP